MRLGGVTAAFDTTEKKKRTRSVRIERCCKWCTELERCELNEVLRFVCVGSVSCGRIASRLPVYVQNSKKVGQYIEWGRSEVILPTGLLLGVEEGAQMWTK